MKTNKTFAGVSRRQFVQTIMASGAVLALPRLIHAAPPTSLPSRTLRIGCIGVGGKGADDLSLMRAHRHTKIVACCDIDSVTLANALKHTPGAVGYADWRELLEEEKLDAVTVSTPDHMHAPITMTALSMGLHTFTQKPLTHDIYEARQVTAEAVKRGVATQMGTHGHSAIGYRLTVRLLQDRAVGRIKEIIAWTNRPIWPQGPNEPTQATPLPHKVNWYLWLGTAPDRPYIKDAFHPFKWRGWLDFGTGAIGDIGCHLLDIPFTALGLGPVKSVRMEGPAPTQRFATSEVINFEFDGTPLCAGKTLKLTWMDGGKKPPREIVKLGKDAKGQPFSLPGSAIIFIGEKGNILTPLDGAPQLLPRGDFAKYQRPKLAPIHHYHLWVDACLGKTKTNCPFEYAGPLTESVLMGTLASRFPGQQLLWDSANLRVSNFPKANQFIRRSYRNGWEVGKL